MEKRKRRLGDRKDGRKLRTLAPYETMSPYFMGKRNDSQNFIQDKFDTEIIDEYVRQKRAEGYKGFGIMHVIIATYIRILTQKPRLNRFIAGQKIYARNEIIVNMAVKKELSEDDVTTIIKVKFEPTDTPVDVYNKFNKELEKAFGKEESSFDGTARLLNYIPGLVKKFTIGTFHVMDYFGFLPSSIINVSPFHGSMVITSMGSLGIPPIYHHLYNFGNVPVFIAFGMKRTENELADDGTVVKRKYMDYTVVSDERICDGYYFASALKIFRRILNHPERLDLSPSEIKDDIE